MIFDFIIDGCYMHSNTSSDINDTVLSHLNLFKHKFSILTDDDCCDMACDLGEIENVLDGGRSSQEMPIDFDNIVFVAVLWSFLSPNLEIKVDLEDADFECIITVKGGELIDYNDNNLMLDEGNQGFINEEYVQEEFEYSLKDFKDMEVLNSFRDTSEGQVYTADIYIKTEPGGEISCGSISFDNIKPILENWGDDQFIENFFEENPPYEYDNLGQAYGVLTSLTPYGDGLNEDEFKSIEYTSGSVVGFPKNSVGSVLDGFYIVRTALGKMSLEIDIESEEPIDMIISSTLVNLSPLEDTLYGSLEFNILGSISYNGNDVDDLVDSYTEAGALESIYLVEFKYNKMIVIYCKDGPNNEVTWKKPFTPLPSKTEPAPV